VPECFENGPNGGNYANRRIVTEFDTGLAHHSLTIGAGVFVSMFVSIGASTTLRMQESGIVNPGLVPVGSENPLCK
jgi:hypothetical protein